MFYSVIETRDFSLFNQSAQALLKGYFINIYIWNDNIQSFDSFSYPEPFLRAVNGARRGALAKSISNWHLIGYNEGYCSNTGYILLPCFHGIRLWIWPEPLVAPRVRRALGTRMSFDCENNEASIPVFHAVWTSVSVLQTSGLR